MVEIVHYSKHLIWVLVSDSSIYRQRSYMDSTWSLDFSFFPPNKRGL
jgi:hypothetical protein